MCKKIDDCFLLSFQMEHCIYVNAVEDGDRNTFRPTSSNWAFKNTMVWIPLEFSLGLGEMEWGYLGSIDKCKLDYVC